MADAASKAPPEGWEAAYEAWLQSPVRDGEGGPADDWVLVREALFEAWGYDDALNAKVIAAHTALDRLAAAPPPPGEADVAGLVEEAERVAANLVAIETLIGASPAAEAVTMIKRLADAFARRS